MNSFFSARRFRRCLAALCLSGGLVVSAQAQSEPGTVAGQALDQATGQPLPYASVGVLGRPVGTVADAEGRFRLAIPAQYNQDSLRISLVGYRAFTMPVREFRRRVCPAAEAGCAVALVPAPQTALAEVKVRPGGRAVRRVLGNSNNSQFASQLFASNVLGTQIGQRIRIKHPSMLEQVSFHINECTYDSVFYRVNVYRLGPDGHPDEQRNVLPEAVYVRLAKAQTADRIRVDLSRYQLWLEPGQEVAVCLELVRDLGPGRLLLTATVLGGPLFEKHGIAESWEKIGAFGMGIDATVTEIR
ncbi:carboxypeptidase-like regulatory domain-containing protein [Hymenobacter weizhouensis]|uniref:carboxypeptidase-like regulatory domain-containing protein n=1 Tax=Hymenobacter sp. YIM 151500-1 TaxID=2987689 RepID=UPI0022271EC8|nr:carboxypeptidase-like regulatory domain-containing protein [Hymenobacter sp. YIM 151500-1]UYZ61651.1 carboxypeptidase-like regulatory domain-containing protein [Hymenobacter sp. YIM 151500-1]